MSQAIAARDVTAGVGQMPHEAAEAARKEQVRNTWITAFSNLSTAYNLVNINLAHVIMENQYCGGDNCKGSVTIAGTACLAGAIIGQLTFGYVGDCLGRSRALQLTMMLSILGALVSAFAVPIDSSKPESVFVFLSITRFFLGVGVGGVYPLAATIAAESSDSTNRGRMVSLVFSMQGVGTLLVPLVGMVFLGIFDDPIARKNHDHGLPGISWRLLLGVGALPGLLLLPFKVKSKPRTSPAEHQPHEASLPSRASMSLGQALQDRRYWPSIIGCAGGWLLFDITFYGNTLFSPTVLKSVFHQGSATPTHGDTIKENLCWQLAILALIGLPGYYVSVWLMDRAGRKNIQIQGFFFMAVLYAVLAIFLQQMKDQPVLLLIVYGLTFFFSNFGPNSTTFILPSESFPYEVRSSLNGFCAASGKLGAVIGSSAFKPISNSGKNGTNVAFYLCTACALLGIVSTVFFVEDRRNRGMGGETFVGGESTASGSDAKHRDASA